MTSTRRRSLPKLALAVGLAIVTTSWSHASAADDAPAGPPQQFLADTWRDTRRASVPLPTPPAVAGDERAWLALGDSYSSGEGIEGTPAGRSKVLERDCRRATGDGMEPTAWAAGAYRQVQAELNLTEQTFVACTGALADEVETQIVEAKALSGRDKWDIVSFSFGGNDIGFGDVIKGCTDIDEAIKLKRTWRGRYPEGCDVGEAELRARIDALVGTRQAAPGYRGKLTLPDLYDKVAKVVEPGGDVIVAGYPNLVEEVGRWPLWLRSTNGRCAFIDNDDVAMLRSALAYLNEQIAATVAAADQRHRDDGIRFHFLDIAKNPYELDENPSNRHGLCSDDSWINGVQVDINSGGHPYYINRSFHPKQVGHTATANVLAQFLLSEIGDEDLRRRLGDLGPGELPDDLKRQLAVRYAPILKFHKDENSFPISHPRLLQNTELVRKVPKRLRRDQTTVVVRMGEVTAGDLHNRPDSEYYLNIRDELKENRIEQSDPELWYEFHGDVRAITYHLTYASNTGANNHEGDTERVKIFFDDDWRPSRMIYSGHTTPTEVKDWDHVVVVRGRPCVFVAKGSHANYPWPGKYPSDVRGGRPRDDASEQGASLDLAQRPPADITTSPLWKAQAKIGNLGHTSFTTGVAAPGNQQDLETYPGLGGEKQSVGMAEATARCAAGLAPVTPPQPKPSAPVTPPATGAACSTEISADLGERVEVIDDLCVDGWAYIDACPGCGGDTQQVVRRVDGVWSVVLAFPIGPDQPRCRAEWEAKGMPAAILDRIHLPCTEAPPPKGEEGASPCPLLSDEDAATALGLDTLTMDGQGICTWITSEGKPALQVLKADYLRSPDAATPEEQARVYGEGTCSLDEPRLITASGAVGIVCGKEDGNSAVFTSAHAYQVNIGDPLGSADNAKLAKNDALANVIEKLQLGDG